MKSVIQMRTGAVIVGCVVLGIGLLLAHSPSDGLAIAGDWFAFLGGLFAVVNLLLLGWRLMRGERERRRMAREERVVVVVPIVALVLVLVGLATGDLLGFVAAGIGGVALLGVIAFAFAMAARGDG